MKPGRFSLIGFGLLISSVCATQQQAFLGVFCFIMPAILLSGFVAQSIVPLVAITAVTLGAAVVMFRRRVT